MIQLSCLNVNYVPGKCFSDAGQEHINVNLREPRIIREKGEHKREYNHPFLVMAR